VQLDRGLYGVLVVDDPAEPGAYDDEWVVVLDDWLDGTGRTPDDVLATLRSGPGMSGMSGSGDMSGDMSGMSGMGGAGGSSGSSILGDGGDVDYPAFLLNGHSTADPAAFRAEPGQRVRIRLVNAGTDTAFRVALGGHQLTVTHSDGFPVVPVVTDALLIAMGERYDVTVTLADGVFPLVGSAEGKAGQALAVVRTGAGSVPGATARPTELDGRVLLGTQLVAAESVRLPTRAVDTRHDVLLSGSMQSYRWAVNGQPFPDSPPLDVHQDERVRLVVENHTMMFHPIHLHGHTFEVQGGARKDTVVVLPMQQVTVDLDATNPGQWMTHCHNLYHAETGMMTVLSYRS
jgi:FtsP/CotA-like multicopper oxidase with cupredoxin domain